jgi:two-component system NtrC family sensor kinase
MAELKDAQARVIQQEKMASIGQLAAGVAHEINNPMGYITSNMNTLSKYAKRLARLIELQEAVIANGANEASRTELEEMRSRDKIDYVLKDFDDLIAESLEGAERVRKIVQDLKSFSRADSHEPVPCDINDCLHTTANIVHNEIKYVATLEMNLTELPPVVCHPQQISQVLMNLLVNAAHAIEKQGAITIATSHDDQWVSIRISDTGKGIPKEIRKRIFEPFFTTKEVGKGTGLGLAISLDIINRHGGELSVESEAGRGTTFTIRLPLARTSGLEGVLENTSC